MSENVVLIHSGGIDSTVLLYQLLKEGHKVTAISFTYGSKHNIQEAIHATSICAVADVDRMVIPLDFMPAISQSALMADGGPIPEGHYESPTMIDTIVPFRNGIMLSIAAGYADNNGMSSVYIGAHGGDHAVYPDCRAEYIHAMDRAVKLGTSDIVAIKAPFLGMSKADIVKLGDKLEVPFKYTWTCYKGKYVHCGKCGACVERREAFQLAGVKDPTVYEA